MLMAEKLTPKDIAKYKEKSKRAINGLNIAIQKASEIAQTPIIGEKWKYIADCMGLKQEEGNSYYNTYISLNSNVFFLLRNANHNNTIPELYNKREKNGRPNKRFVVFFQRDNKFGDVVSDFLESEHHTITYPPNALDTENDVIAYCKAYISLFQNGSTTFPKLPSIQENNRKTQYKMKQKIRLTEGDLHRIIRNCINEVLNEIESENIDEGFGNWVQAGINGLSDIKNYSQGPSNSKLVNWTDNVRRAKQNYDDLDTVQKAQKYGYQDAPKVQMAQARRDIYTEPGSNRQVSDKRRSQAYQTMINAGQRQRNIDSRRQMRQYDQNNGTNLYNQRYGR
jgi:hypothetical protein